MTSFVVATSGHVDHGKSSLVRALTGTEPDRWEEERRRGLTIDLGFAWLQLGSGREVSFVDVPGHERFLGNMLAGLGPAPVVCFVVAADQGWQEQSTDHLAAVRALGIEYGLVAITRTDLAPDAVPALRDEIRARLADTGLADAPIVAVSSKTGDGLPDLLATLDEVLARVPHPDGTAPVRLWIDRAFPISGAGTVVTGTLAGGRLAKGDALALASRDDDDTVAVRGLQAHGEGVATASPVSRVAVNLRGVPVDAVGRGDALLTPGAWWRTATVDVRRVSGVALDEANEQLVVHVGSASVAAHVRAFDAEHSRLQLDSALPLRIGDRMVLRDPGARSVVGGVQVLDVDPPALRRRGAGARRASVLATMTPEGSVELEVERRGAMRRDAVARLGVRMPAGGAVGAPAASRTAGNSASSRPDRVESVSEPTSATALPDSLLGIGPWLVAKRALLRWARQLRSLVDADRAADALSPGVTRGAAVDALELPDAALLGAVVKLAKLESAEGRIRVPGAAVTLGAAEDAVATLERRLAAEPFAAPEAHELDALRLGAKELATAERAGRLLRLKDGVVLLPDAPARAMRELSALPQPFTTSQARQALGTTRRIVIPLLEHLDSRGWTRRVDAQHREVRRGTAGA